MVNEFSFSQLAAFNHPSSRQAAQPLDEEVEQEEYDAFGTLTETPDGQEFFNPAVTAYKYYQSTIHYHENSVSLN